MIFFFTFLQKPNPYGPKIISCLRTFKDLDPHLYCLRVYGLFPQLLFLPINNTVMDKQFCGFRFTESGSGSSVSCESGSSISCESGSRVLIRIHNTVDKYAEVLCSQILNRIGQIRQLLITNYTYVKNVFFVVCRLKIKTVKTCDLNQGRNIFKQKFSKQNKYRLHHYQKMLNVKFINERPINNNAGTMD
jgi:hypothetical protein